MLAQASNATLGAATLWPGSAVIRFAATSGSTRLGSTELGRNSTGLGIGSAQRAREFCNQVWVQRQGRSGSIETIGSVRPIRRGSTNVGLGSNERIRAWQLQHVPVRKCAGKRKLDAGIVAKCGLGMRIGPVGAPRRSSLWHSWSSLATQVKLLLLVLNPDTAHVRKSRACWMLDA